jgi:hypothetical protein
VKILVPWRIGTIAPFSAPLSRVGAEVGLTSLQCVLMDLWHPFLHATKWHYAR